MRVILDGEAEVARGFVSRHLHHVLATAKQFDNRQRQIAEMRRIGFPLFLEKLLETQTVRLSRKIAAEGSCQCDDAIPTRRSSDDPANAREASGIEKSRSRLIR